MTTTEKEGLETKAAAREYQALSGPEWLLSLPPKGV